MTQNLLTIGNHDSTSRRFGLPLDFVTWTNAILARKGKGKSYLASVMAEELLAAKQQVVVIDPTGGWYGLRSSADGKGDGFGIYVLGGDHADITLEEQAGETIARWIVEKGFSAVIDISLFRKGQVRRFVTPFLETLYRLNREPLHLFVDEADDIAPQKPFGDEAAMVGAMEDVVKRGRKKGIGCTLITQRPADLAKQVLTQCEMVIALGMNHPRDLAAVKEWINVHADPTKAEEMIASLPSLPTGTAWFWAPSFGDLFERVSVRKRQTYDSSATPKPGQRIMVPKRLAPVDVRKLGEEIASTVEQAKANDPARLKATIAQLEKQLAAKARGNGHVDQASIEKAVAEAVTAIESKWRAALESANDWISTLGNKLEEVNRLTSMKVRTVDAPRATAPRPARTIETRAVAPNPPARVARAASAVSGDATGAASRVLAVLAQFPDGLDDRYIAARAGVSRKKSTYRNALTDLRKRGYLRDQGGLRTLTAEGIAAAADTPPLPTGPELLEYYRAQLGTGAARQIFEVLVERSPMALDRVALANMAGVDDAKSTFRNALTELRTWDLFEGRDELRLSREVAEAIR